MTIVAKHDVMTVRYPGHTEAKPAEARPEAKNEGSKADGAAETKSETKPETKNEAAAA